MQLKLAAFDFCPYCQRVRILLEHYGLPHELVRIDPNAPPGWFAAASPHGRVPVLVVDDTPILESAVIGELIDEIGGGRMFPAEPVARAQVRALVELVSACQASFGAMIRAEDEAAFIAARDQLHDGLGQIEAAMDNAEPYFSGSELCMVDVVLAPLLNRMHLLQPVLPCFPEAYPRLQRLAETLARLPEVDRSVDGDAPKVFASMVAHLNQHGYVGSRWAGSRQA
jgi:glutathione S-transferase